MTQNKLPLQKQQKPKSEITAGASKTQRTAGNQTEEDKKKTTEDKPKTATDKNKQGNQRAQKGAEQQGKNAKASSGKSQQAGKAKNTEGKKAKPQADKNRPATDTTANERMKGAKRKLSKLAHDAKARVFSEADLRSATEAIKKEYLLDGLTLSKVTNKEAKADKSNTRWRVKFYVKLGVSDARIKTYNEDLRGTPEPETGTLQDSLQIVATRAAASADSGKISSGSYLGATANGVGKNFKGNFGHADWHWEGYPKGPVTRHPANDFLGYQNHGDLSDIKPKLIEYTYIGGNSRGAIEGEKKRWTNNVDNELRLLQEIIHKAGGAPDAGTSTEFQETNAQGDKDTRREPNGNNPNDADLNNKKTVSYKKEKKTLYKKSKTTYPKEVTQEAKKRLLAFYQRTYPGLQDMDDVYLAGNKARQWQAHHVHERSWGGHNQSYNFQFLPRPDQHQEFTNWWEHRRDDIRTHLFPEDGSEGATSEHGATPLNKK